MQGKPTLDAAGEDRETDTRVLEALLEPDAQRPWAVEELAREIGDADSVSDSLGRLARAGLVHRLDGFVWAARSALAADTLGE